MACAVLIGLTGVLADPGVRGKMAGLMPIARGMDLGLNAQSLTDQGKQYIERYDQKGNIDRAIEVFTKAIEKDKDSARAWAGLGDAYLAKNRESICCF